MKAFGDYKNYNVKLKRAKRSRFNYGRKTNKSF